MNLPTPVILAGGALCLLGGYLIGVVAGPNTPDRTTGIVESYDPATKRLCLSGDGPSAHERADEDGILCGAWRRSGGSSAPTMGQEFGFVAITTSEAPEDEEPGLSQQVLIYGDALD